MRKYKYLTLVSGFIVLTVLCGCQRTANENTNMTDNVVSTSAVTNTTENNNICVNNPRIRGSKDEPITEWDTLYFGSYLQSDTNGDGVVNTKDEKEKIRWRVLDVNGSDAFLMADRILEQHPYNKKKTDITWEKSSLRTWMNRKFFNSAFTKKEQKSIRLVTVENPLHELAYTQGGKATHDRIYLPSRDEMRNIEYGFAADIQKESQTRCALVTDYAGQRGAFFYNPKDNKSKANDKGDKNKEIWELEEWDMEEIDPENEQDENKFKTPEYSGYWWLRSPGATKDYASRVDSEGSGEIDENVNSRQMGIRPVIHLDLSQAVWTKGKPVYSDETAWKQAREAQDTDEISTNGEKCDTPSSEKEKRPITGKIDRITVGDFEYRYVRLDDSTARLTAMIPNDSKSTPDTLQIPEQIDGYKVTQLGITWEDQRSSLTWEDEPWGDERDGLRDWGYTITNELVDYDHDDLSISPLRRKIRHVIIPEGVEKIFGSAFAGFVSLTEVSLPDSVVSLTGKVFYGCDSLKMVQGGRGLTRIEPSIFSGCKKLSEICIPSDNTYLESKDGCVITRKLRRLLCVAPGCQTIQIPNSVKMLGEDCLKYSYAKNIKIPASLK